MKPHAFGVASFLVAFAIWAPLSSDAQAIQDGSFEDPAYPPNSINGGGGAQWTAGGTGGGSNVFILTNNFGNFGTTPFGNQYLAFTAPGASDQQTSSGFLAGQSYVLSLFISDVANNAAPQLQVTLTGAANATDTFSVPQTSFLSFQEFELPFTTTSDGDITLALIDVGPASVAVDNVTLLAVPEPSTVFAMVLVSTVLAGGAIRRFRNARYLTRP